MDGFEALLAEGERERDSLQQAIHELSITCAALQMNRVNYLPSLDQSQRSTSSTASTCDYSRNQRLSLLQPKETWRPVHHVEPRTVPFTSDNDTMALRLEIKKLESIVDSLQRQLVLKDHTLEDQARKLAAKTMEVEQLKDQLRRANRISR